MSVATKTRTPSVEPKAPAVDAEIRHERIEMAVLGALAVGTSLVFLAPTIVAAL